MDLRSLAPFAAAIVAAVLFEAARAAARRILRTKPVNPSISIYFPDGGQIGKLPLDAFVSLGVPPNGGGRTTVMTHVDGGRRLRTLIHCSFQEAAAAVCKALDARDAATKTPRADEPSPAPEKAEPEEPRAHRRTPGPAVRISPRLIVRPEVVSHIEAYTDSTTAIHTTDGRTLYVCRPVKDVADELAKGLAR